MAGVGTETSKEEGSGGKAGKYKGRLPTSSGKDQRVWSKWKGQGGRRAQMPPPPGSLPHPRASSALL